MSQQDRSRRLFVRPEPTVEGVQQAAIRILEHLHQQPLTEADRQQLRLLIEKRLEQRRQSAEQSGGDHAQPT